MGLVYLLSTLFLSHFQHYQKEHVRTESLAYCMLRIIFIIPVLLGTLQAFIFRSYSLRNKHMIPALPV